MNHYSGLIAAEIRGELGRQKMSHRELARRLGVNHAWCHRRLNGQQEITVDDLYRIAAVLGKDPLDLLPLKASA